ncbi:MAG: hypothetical protein CO187_02475, partial [Zetaproteobacteria bacterium CG_4_9_14_3_um_filter_53_7]
MKFITAILASATLLLGGCLYEPVHQGNRLSADKVNQVQEGQTKFKIEQILGTPILNSTLHPNRVTYYEEFEDEDSGDMKRRGVEITYDDALRARHIRRF